MLIGKTVLLGISGGISVAFALNFTVFAFYIVGIAAFIYGNMLSSY